MNRDETYKPEVVNEWGQSAYATFLLEVEHCPTCGRWVLRGDANRLAAAFPKYYVQHLDRQLRAAGMVMQSAATNKDDANICVECAKQGRASFVCYLCKQERPTDALQNSIGDPADHLCKVCYETVPAKKWEEAEQALYDLHRYDYC